VPTHALTSLPPDDERILLLLGLLTAQDRHGYEINDFIERTLHHVIHLKKATAYQLLERLEKHGLIGSRIEQYGQRPNRRVYQITEAGRERFGEMLRTQLAQEEALILTGNVPVMFSEHLTPSEMLASFRQRLEGVKARLSLYDTYNLPCSVGVGLAMERIRVLTQADHDWLTETIERLEQHA
jgi:DNA-binding PadR family transcriptional regulator